MLAAALRLAMSVFTVILSTSANAHTVQASVFEVAGRFFILKESVSGFG